MKRAVITLMTSLLCIAAVLGVLHAVTNHDLEAELHAASNPHELAQLQTELNELAALWEVVSGRYGFPFWDRARNRWGAHEISAVEYREFVVGYRAMLRDGCPKVASSSVRTEIAAQVHELLKAACDARLHALTAQLAMLDATLSGSIAPDQRREHFAAFNRSYTDSLRSTRLAMDLAQGALTDANLEALPNTAFR